MKTETVTKTKAKAVRKKKVVKKYNNSLAAFMESVKSKGWTISYDEDIFNFAK